VDLARALDADGCVELLQGTSLSLDIFRILPTPRCYFFTCLELYRRLMPVTVLTSGGSEGLV